MSRKHPVRVGSSAVSLCFIIITVFAVLIISALSPGEYDATPEVSLEGADRLTVLFLDVGEGDCSVILTPEGQTVMIDTGPPDSKQALTDQLRSFGVKNIDVLILTHSHTDHAGLAGYIIGRCSVKTLILPNLDDASAFSAALDAASSAGTEIQRAISPHTLNVGAARLDFVFDGNDIVTDNSNSSIEILLTYKERSVLFTGDNEAGVEDHLVKEYKNMNADVLKVAHHGSLTSTTGAFLRAVSPRYAVISVGAGNNYDHPSPTVLERLENVCEKVFRTDRDGAVKLITDGTNIKFFTFDEQKNDKKAA